MHYKIESKMITTLKNKLFVKRNMAKNKKMNISRFKSSYKIFCSVVVLTTCQSQWRCSYLQRAYATPTNYSEVSIKRTHSIKRTVCLDFQKSLLNVPYDLNLMKFIAKRTVSIKRTVCKFYQLILFKIIFQAQCLVVINL